MGLFSKKPVIHNELSFNREKLQEGISRVSKIFYQCQRENGLQGLLEVMRLERNIAIIQTHTATDERGIRDMQARIRAFSDILTHVERCIIDGKRAEDIEKKKTSPGAVQQSIRKRGKTAGLSI